MSFGSAFGNKNGFSGAPSEEHEVALNLMPMIDVLTSLLFFLLISFGAVVIALINASVPVATDGDGEAQTSKLKITMGLSVTSKAILASGSHDLLSEDQLKKLSQTFPAVKGGGYDYVALNKFLLGIKKQYPESETVIITPEADILHETLVAVMDASREHVEKRNRRLVKTALFPQVVVSTLVK